jgi:hypothetical protein
MIITILRKGARLVTEKILDATKLLRQCARAYYSVRDLIVVHNLVPVDRLAHIQINTEAASHVSPRFRHADKKPHLMGMM